MMNSVWRRLGLALALAVLLGCLATIAYYILITPRSGTSLRLPQNLADAKARWKLARTAGARGGMADFVDTYLYGKIDTSDAILRRESLDLSLFGPAKRHHNGIHIP
jgi:hypothetical protein